MTGVNIDKMIEMAEALEDDEDNTAQAPRRRLSKTEPKKTGRRLT